MSPTPPPVQTDEDAPTRLVVRPDAHDRDTFGALLNPDTRLRYASAGPRDLADLAALCEEYGIEGDARDAVQLLVLRARTRLAHEHASRLRQTAEQYDAEARSYAEVAVERLANDEPGAASDALQHAASVALRARALRSVAL